MTKNLFISITSKDGSSTDVFATNEVIESSIFGCSVSLNSVTYSMALYEPDHFCAELSLDNNTKSFSEVREAVIGSTAKVYFAESKSDSNIISFNLFVFKATPKYTKDNNIFLKLDIYSLDKLMDIQKYSQAYTAKRLGNDIIASETITFDKQGYGLNFDLTPRLMGYKLPDQTDDTQHEIIQPYVVQYNETFRSMLNRVANRCGEFLYWHEGKLQYGLPVQETSLEQNQQFQNIMDIADEITESAADSEDFTAMSITKSHRDGSGKMDNAFIDAGDDIRSKSYDLEIGTPDFNKTLSFVDTPLAAYKERPMGEVFGIDYETNTDDKEKWNKKTDDSDCTQFWIDTVFQFANSGGLSDFLQDWITGFMVDGPLGNLTDKKESQVAKRKLNHRPIEGDDKDIYVGFDIDEQATKGFSDKVGNDLFESEYAENNRSISHFGTHADAYSGLKDNDLLDKKTLLGQTFYAAVQTIGQNAAMNAIDIKIVANAETNLHIGQIVTLNNTEYIITRIDGSFISDSEAKLQTVCVNVHAIPVTTINNHRYYIPEPIEQSVRVMDGNSTAVITDTDDPYKQGRVRVRFTWQNNKLPELNATDLNNCDFNALKEAFSKEGDTFGEYNKKDHQTLKNRYVEAEKIDAKAYCYKKLIKSIVVTPEDKSEEPYFIVRDITFSSADMHKNGLYSEHAVRYLGNILTEQNVAKKIDYSTFLDNKAESFKIAYLCFDNIYYFDAEVDGFFDNKSHLIDCLRDRIESFKKKMETLAKDSEEYKDYESAMARSEAKIKALENLSYSNVELIDYVSLSEPASKVAKYKKAYKDQIAKVEKAKLTDEYRKDSTPWIRMATPMAGENNKFFMAPAVNSEVLIGFENGNPERPYVVGSLFNGTNKAGKDYSIQSENKTSISISDENVGWDDIVSMVGLPVVKTITQSASSMIMGDSLTEGKLPMGGKIVFKDQFGFYNMTMSSKSRKVSIDCPLGKISLSAFSGITISAPNGNIKIEGKNVSITAGDKLILKSGTNKDIRDSTNADFAGFFSDIIVKMATNAATSFIGDKAIDLSMVRSFWEVVFRPLNGTMAIKSNRHLLLEAGKGQAELPIEAMKATKPFNVTQIFPNYPYYLIEEYVKSIKNNGIEMQKALADAYAAVKGVDIRDTIASVDKEPRPDIGAYNAVVNSPAPPKMTTLSKVKMNHILQSCVILDRADNTWKVTTVANEIMKYCPYPDGVAELDNAVICWQNSVKETGAKVANLFNTVETAKNKTNINNSQLNKVKDTIAKVGKDTPIPRVLDNLQVSSGLIKYQKLNDPSHAPIDFDINNFKTIENYVDITFNPIQIQNENKLKYGIIRWLHDAELVVYIDKNEKIKNGQTRYILNSTLPEWQGSGTGLGEGPLGYRKIDTTTDPSELTWDDFVNHIKPADSVVDAAKYDSKVNDAKVFVGNIMDGLKDSFMDWIDTSNFNWIMSQERNLWDPSAHPGMILMSDDKGGKTASFTGAGNTLAINYNHSLKALISNMGQSVQNEKSDENHVFIKKRWTVQKNLKDNNIKF